jgi:hypothetical protein
MEQLIELQKTFSNRKVLIKKGKRLHILLQDDFYATCKQLQQMISEVVNGGFHVFRAFQFAGEQR